MTLGEAFPGFRRGEDPDKPKASPRGGLVQLAGRVSAGIFPGRGQLVGVDRPDAVLLADSSDVVGLVIHLVGGTHANVGQARRIVARNGEGCAVLDHPLPKKPAVGDEYMLLIDVRRRAELLVKLECSSALARAGLLPYFYVGRGRGAVACAERAYELAAHGGHAPRITEESGFWHMPSLRVPVPAAAFGARVEVSAVSHGTLSLWAIAR